MLQHQRQNFAKEFINKTVCHIVSLIFASLLSVFVFAVSLLWTSLSINREAVAVVARVFLLNYITHTVTFHRQ